jgi:MerR family transcriptional regulator/heat shock protein HspR
MIDDNSPVFVISVAAQLSGLHPQTLRTYDKLGLVSPDRAVGRGRRYSSRDIMQLREVQRLSQEQGVNLAGIKRILDLENQVSALQQRTAELVHELEIVHAGAARQVAEAHASHRRDLVPVRAMTAAVMWRTEVVDVRAASSSTAASPSNDGAGPAQPFGGVDRPLS